jgi:CubicO group peptidase (beta-lactamase class C family)
VDRGDVQALVVLAARRGIVIMHEALGRQNPDSDSRPALKDSIFPLASISKVITATAVMILVEEGRVGLNRRVAEYLPEFRGEGKDAVLIRHLLTHTSGLRDEDLDRHAEASKGTIEIPPDEPTQAALLGESLALRWDAPLWKPPGVEMSYSGYGYRLLHEIVRRVTGRSLNDFARARIFEPLGMIDTHYGVPDKLEQRLVRRPPEALDEESDRLWRAGWGSGGAFSTAKDMATLAQMFLNRGAYGEARVLSPASVAAMTRNQVPGLQAHIGDQFFPDASWSLGWSIHGAKTGSCGSLSSPEAFEHWGSGGSYLWADPVYQLVGVYFSVIPVADGHPQYTELQDLFTDAVTAAIVED